jgi:hypothetical protein
MKTAKSAVVNGSVSSALEQWLSAVEDAEPPTKGPVLIVCFRNSLWIEWALYAACRIYRLGYRPLLLHSEKEVVAAYLRADHSEARGSKAVWDRARSAPCMEFVNLDDFLPDARELTAEQSEFGAREAPYVVAHDLRAEAKESGSAQQQAAVAYYRQALPRLSVACERALERSKPLGAVCPSGLIGWSGAFLRAAQRLSVPVRYVEFWTIRPGHMITTLNRPAVDHDLRDWAERVGPLSPDREREVQQLRKFRDDPAERNGSWLRNFHSAQRSPVGAPLPPSVQTFLRRPGPRFLLGPNVIGDSATLKRETIFRSQQEWIEPSSRQSRSGLSRSRFPAMPRTSW